MTIDEAISHAEEVAEQEECFINYPHSDIVRDDLNIESRKHYVAEQRQLAEWLTELKEAKRLLKAAMNDIYKECTCNTKGCDICEHLRETCDYDDRFVWRYKDEVFKIIDKE